LGNENQILKKNKKKKKKKKSHPIHPLYAGSMAPPLPRMDGCNTSIPYVPPYIFLFLRSYNIFSSEFKEKLIKLKSQRSN
jgi:hypothetical protein